ncbi:MAG: YfiR family protein [Longimicrobiales bacterium]
MKLPIRSQLGLWIGVCCLAAMLFPSPVPASRDEYTVKGAFIHNFANLIEWPASAFPTPNAPLRVAILGPPTFASNMVAYLEGKTVAGRPLQVSRIRSEGAIGEFHIVFVGEPARSHQRNVIKAARGSRALTVGESDGFASDGGMINFFLDGKKVRFEINRPAAETAGLKISSRLLRLAVLVEGKQ